MQSPVQGGREDKEHGSAAGQDTILRLQATLTAEGARECVCVCVCVCARARLTHGLEVLRSVCFVNQVNTLSVVIF